MKTTVSDNKQTIFGFDILPMSSTSRDGGVHVALVIKDSEDKVKHYPNISKKKLIQLARQHKPKFIGTDNPAEILEEKESIGKFCKMLPPNSELVQVNLLSNGTAVSMSKLVRSYNLQNTSKKMSPVRTSEAIIQLIELGAGMVLEPFEKETIIDVGRPRSRGKGGWSQARYERQGEEIVHRATEEIKVFLEKSNISFDLVSKSTKYGAHRSRFHIFSAKETIISNVKSLSTFPAKLRIWSPTKQIITHRPLNTKKIIPSEYNNKLKRLIVGIDPGMTTGVAISSLTGEILSVFSKKNLSKGELVTRLTDFGTPAAICADVNPVPAFVSKLASTYNAEIVSPTYELSQDEKRELTKDYADKNRIDSHERDALSAVMIGLKKYQPLFIKFNKYDYSRTELDMAMGMVIRGLSTHEAVTAIEILRNKEVPKKELVIKQETSEEELVGRIYNLIGDMAESEDTISNLRAHITRLESRIFNQQKHIEHLKFQLSGKQDEITRKILESDLLEQKDLVINHLRNRLREEIHKSQQITQKSRDLEEIIGSAFDENKVALKVLPIFSHRAIYQLQLENGLSDGDIIYIIDPTGGGPQTCLNLIETKLKMIFHEGKLPDIAEEIFIKNKIPFASSKNYNIDRINQYALISQEDLERALLDFEVFYEKKQLVERRKRIDLEITNYQYQRDKHYEQNSISYDDFEPDEEDNVDLF